VNALRRKAVLLALLLAPSAGWAQATTIGDNGLNMGEGRLHPYVDAELDYDSAAGFFGPGNGSIGSLTGEWILHVRPGFRLEYPASWVNLSLNADLDRVQYLGLANPNAAEPSHWEGAANFESSFNQKGAVEFDLGDNFSYLQQTTDPVIGIGVLTLHNEAHASLPIHPGGGALSVTPGGSITLEQYSPIDNSQICTPPSPNDPNCNPVLLANFNFVDVQGNLAASWRFLPKTAVSIMGSYDARAYQNDPTNAAQLMHAGAGLTGLLTSKIAVTAKLGWAQEFAKATGTLTAHAELNYLVSDTSNMRIGYLRDLQSVPQFGVYADDRGYAELRFFLGGRLTLRAYGAYDALAYAGGTRSDQMVTIDAGPQYQFVRWLIAAAGYTFNYRNTNVTQSALVNYTRNVGYVRLTLTY